jgi:hypothetical protein
MKKIVEISHDELKQCDSAGNILEKKVTEYIKREKSALDAKLRARCEENGYKLPRDKHLLSRRDVSFLVYKKGEAAYDAPLGFWHSYNMGKRGLAFGFYEEIWFYIVPRYMLPWWKRNRCYAMWCKIKSRMHNGTT